jgi:phosphonate ABC transporter permease subunit PhnE
MAETEKPAGDNQADNKKEGSRLRTVKNVLVGIIVFVTFAYGFQVTEIDLEEPKEENRQAQLTNVIRALARPDLLEYDIDRVEVDAAILVPCPDTQVPLPDLSQPGPSIELSETCAEPGSEITVSGSGFESGDDILIFFVPYKEDVSEEVQLPLADKRVPVDDDGNFSAVVVLRKDRTSAEPQKVRAVVNRSVGLPRPSETVYDTFDKIVETLFLALIATTLGVIISVPVSFLAARNLMINVTTAFASLMTIVAVAPIGWFVGSWLYETIGGSAADLIAGNDVPVAAMLWVPALLFLSVQTLARRGDSTGQSSRIRRYGLGILSALGVALVLGIVAGLGQRLGLLLSDLLNLFSFVGDFIFIISDALELFLPLAGGLVGLFVAVSLAGTGSRAVLRHSGSSIAGRIYSVIMAVIAGAVVFLIPTALIVWLYKPVDPASIYTTAAVIGGVVFGVIALLVKEDYPVQTGSVIYYFTRTILNIQRAIEPLILAIVFVVWVGIGPFAGVLALTLHTVAALGKLYSEQVENIAQGPIEAVTATGANKLQTIIYAVVPQIVPPYIAFTIYRWDINVRMSTIIGFAGGGGIGFLLLQNLNLLKYRQAAVQMIAIAIVVASLDYVSARIRERII